MNQKESKAFKDYNVLKTVPLESSELVTQVT